MTVHWDWVFGAGMAVLAILQIVRWSIDRGRDASWSDASFKRASKPPASPASRGVFLSQCLVAAALGALVLLRYFGAFPAPS